MSSDRDELQQLTAADPAYYEMMLGSLYTPQWRVADKLMVLSHNLPLSYSSGAHMRTRAIDAALNVLSGRGREYLGVFPVTPATVAFANEACSVVILDQLWAASSAINMGLGADVIYLAHNCEATLARALGVPDKLVSHIESSERDVVELAKDVWVCCAEDAEDFGRLGRATHVVPNIADVVHIERNPEPRRIMFVGDARYPPNEKAILTLLAGLEGTALKLDLATRTITTKMYPVLRVVADRVQIVDDLNIALSRATAMVTLLPQTSGTSIKILEAWAAKVPVIASAGAMRGLRAEPGTHYLEAETMGRVVEILESQPPYDLELMANRAREYWYGNYSPPALRSVLDRLLDTER